MRPNRFVLTFVASTLATVFTLAVGGSLPPNATASPNDARHAPLRTQAPAFYRMQLGDFEITALSDGTVPLPLDKMMTHIKPQEVRKLLAAGFETQPVETSINAYLVNTGSKLLLIDAGAGKLFGAHGGKLLTNLKAAGYEPGNIDAVLLTHLHGDHSGGLTVDGQRFFPNAVVYLDKADRDYRFSADAEARAPANQKSMFPQSRADIAAYEAAGKLVLFEGATQLFPGVSTIAARGHTPGHTLYAVESKGEKILFSGDLVHAAAVQMPRPEATIQFDADEHGAASDRRALFREFAAQRTLLAAAHVSFPGIGHIRRDGTGYQWVPVPYSLRGMTN
jgi:glyoxylase-like metal-dependent hydrolase (beta-lactamase superfamily II)